MIHYSNNIEEGVVNTERDKTMATPYTAYVTPATPDVIEYRITYSYWNNAGHVIDAIRAVRVIARGYLNKDYIRADHPLAGLREAKDFVTSIRDAGAANPYSITIAMPASDEHMHEALIATVLCHLRVPFTLERKT